MIQTYATGTNSFAVIAWATGYTVAHLSSQYRLGYRSVGCAYKTVAEAVEVMNRNAAYYNSAVA